MISEEQVKRYPVIKTFVKDMVNAWEETTPMPDRDERYHIDKDRLEEKYKELDLLYAKSVLEGLYDDDDLMARIAKTGRYDKSTILNNKKFADYYEECYERSMAPERRSALDLVIEYLTREYNKAHRDPNVSIFSMGFPKAEDIDNQMRYIAETFADWGVTADDVLEAGSYDSEKKELILNHLQIENK